MDRLANGRNVAMTVTYWHLRAQKVFGLTCAVVGPHTAVRESTAAVCLACAGTMCGTDFVFIIHDDFG